MEIETNRTCSSVTDAEKRRTISAVGTSAAAEQYAAADYELVADETCVERSGQCVFHRSFNLLGGGGGGYLASHDHEERTSRMERPRRPIKERPRRHRRRVYSLGDFFHLRIPSRRPIITMDGTDFERSPSSVSATHYVSCIGELLLLWADVNTRCAVSACRLYFRPEHTPGGRRMDSHGQDEVIALSEAAIIQLKILVQWMQFDEDCCVTSVERDCRTSSCAAAAAAGQLKIVDHQLRRPTNSTDGADKLIENVDDDDDDNGDQQAKTKQLLLKDGCAEDDVDTADIERALCILPYGRYCRYRALRRRLDLPVSADDQLLLRRRNLMRLDIVQALGGLNGGGGGGSDDCLLFCRDTFEHHPLLESHPDLCNYDDNLVPTFMRDRFRMASWSKMEKHRTESAGSQSPASSSWSVSNEGNDEEPPSSSTSSSSSNSPSPVTTPLTTTTTTTMPTTMTNATNAVTFLLGNSSTAECRASNGLSKRTVSRPSLNHLREQVFLQRLFDFMRKRNTPIERVPSLGFKQVNLYSFYTHAKKFGGYEKITMNKLWKRIYDKLGGNPGSTSAATITRRHYERLLLPFERHEHRSCRNDFRQKGTAIVPSSLTNETTPVRVPSESFLAASMKAGINGSAAGDRSVVTLPLETPLHVSAQTTTKQQQQQLLNKQRKGQQRLNDSRTAEKERMWDEIRRQNALERDRIRQVSAASNRSRSTLLDSARDLLVSSRPVNVVVPLDPCHLQMALRVDRTDDPAGVERSKTEFLLMKQHERMSNETVQMNDRRFVDHRFPIVQDELCHQRTNVATPHRFYLGSTLSTDRSNLNNGSSSGVASLPCPTAPRPQTSPSRMLSVIQRGTHHAISFLMGAKSRNEDIKAAADSPSISATHSKTCAPVADDRALCSSSPSSSEWHRRRSTCFREGAARSSISGLRPTHVKAHPRAAFTVSPVLHKFSHQQFYRPFSQDQHATATRQPREEVVTVTPVPAVFQKNDHRIANGLDDDDDDDILDLTVRP